MSTYETDYNRTTTGHNLTQFNKTIKSILQSRKLQEMHKNCGEKNLSATDQCFTVDTETQKVMNADGTINTTFQNETGTNLDSAYNILMGQYNLGTPDKQTTFTVNEILAMAVAAGYDGDSNQYGESSKFGQDITDIQASMGNSAHFQNDISTTHKDVKELRNKLDNQMREIYNPDQQDPNILLDQSVYVTLVWTVLATSVLYYLFVKL
jgi:hypothetical protein